MLQNCVSHTAFDVLNFSRTYDTMKTYIATCCLHQTLYCVVSAAGAHHDCPGFVVSERKGCICAQARNRQFSPVSLISVSDRFTHQLVCTSNHPPARAVCCGTTRRRSSRSWGARGRSFPSSRPPPFAVGTGSTPSTRCPPAGRSNQGSAGISPPRCPPLRAPPHTQKFAPDPPRAQ